MIKLVRKAASNLAWAACRLLPVKNNKVVFSSFGGKGFGDNPKAIAQELLKENLDLVWLTRDETVDLPAGIRPCRFGSLRTVVELTTAKVWVDNSRGGAHYKKKNQFYLQTWHGFALKCIEASAKNLPASYVEQAKADAKRTDLMVSGSGFMTEIYRRDFWYDGEIAQFGSPRNDVFFRETSAGDEVRDFFGLPRDAKILLYAPTFRDDGSVDAYGLDAEWALEACEKRFGGQWSALLRLHPNAAKLSEGLFAYDGERLIDATPYPDMAQLLLAADLLITDYSSSMFDYALSGKPCVQFATDIEAYQKGRDFYYPLDRLPFPLARSNEELSSLLENFDLQDNQTKWQTFAAEHGFCEDGNASRRCAEWILEKMKGC